MSTRSNIIALIILIIMCFVTGCTTTGRMNGSNSEALKVSLKNVQVHGSLTIGGAEQLTEDAAQEGLGVGSANDIEADVQADGNTVSTPVQ